MTKETKSAASARHPADIFPSNHSNGLWMRSCSVKRRSKENSQIDRIHQIKITPRSCVQVSIESSNYRLVRPLALFLFVLTGKNFINQSDQHSIISGPSMTGINCICSQKPLKLLNRSRPSSICGAETTKSVQTPIFGEILKNGESSPVSK